jgi:hypothetical protein
VGDVPEPVPALEPMGAIGRFVLLPPPLVPGADMELCAKASGISAEATAATMSFLTNMVVTPLRLPKRAVSWRMADGWWLARTDYRLIGGKLNCKAWVLWNYRKTSVLICRTRIAVSARQVCVEM